MWNSFNCYNFNSLSLFGLVALLVLNVLFVLVTWLAGPLTPAGRVSVVVVVGWATWLAGPLTPIGRVSCAWVFFVWSAVAYVWTAGAAYVDVSTGVLDEFKYSFP